MRSPVLTRAEAWRQLKSRRTRSRLKHQVEYESSRSAGGNDDFESGFQPTPSIDLNLVKQNVPSTPIKQDINQEVSREENQQSYHRKVKFSPVIRVCLVPCRSDFLTDFPDLFWARENYQSFKEDALKELRDYFYATGSSVKDSIAAMYQPGAEQNAVVTLLQDKSSTTNLTSSGGSNIHEPAQRPGKFLTHVDSVAQFDRMLVNSESQSNIYLEKVTNAIRADSVGNLVSLDPQQRSQDLADLAALREARAAALAATRGAGGSRGAAGAEGYDNGASVACRSDSSNSDSNSSGDDSAFIIGSPDCSPPLPASRKHMPSGAEEDGANRKGQRQQQDTGILDVTDDERSDSSLKSNEGELVEQPEN
jgi:hypothetical protein